MLAGSLGGVAGGPAALLHQDGSAEGSGVKKKELNTEDGNASYGIKADGGKL